MKKYFIFATLLIVACSKSIDISEQASYSGSVIPIEHSLYQLNSIMNDIYGNTKSLNDISIDIFGRLDTKSNTTNIPDTLLYIVKFGDKGGGAVLSAHTALSSPVLCILETGNITCQEITDAFEQHHTNNSIFNANQAENPFPALIIVNSIINQLNQSELNTTHDKNTKSYYGSSALYGVYLQTKWSQWDPFNDFRTDNAPTGCVATATAQILQFNKTGNPDNKNFDWTLLDEVNHHSNYLYNGSTAAQQEASRFLEYVGNYDNCRITYSPTSSSGYADGAKRCLNNFGYKNVKKYFGFENADKKRVREQLKAGQPVYMDGSKGTNGHAWVIDALYIRNELDDNTHAIIDTDNFYHINWGWHGDCDGFYPEGTFNTTKRAFTDPIDPGTNYEIAEYTWNFRTITHSI